MRKRSKLSKAEKAKREARRERTGRNDRKLMRRARAVGLIVATDLRDLRKEGAWPG